MRGRVTTSATTFIFALGALSGCGTEAREGSAASAPASPAAASAPTPAPEVVARQYLEAGAREDAAAIREAIDPACASDPEISRVLAVRLFDVPMDIEAIEVAVLGTPGATATVSYSVRGSIGGARGRASLPGGAQQEANVSSATKSGRLELKRIDGRYRVTCAPAPP